jgi:Flp pilus assembly protein TadB
MTFVVLAGTLAGAGLFLLGLALHRPATHGASAPGALARFDQERARRRESAGRGSPSPRSGSDLRLQRAGRPLVRQLDSLGITLPGSLRSDLALIGRTVETHLAMSVLGAVLGGFIPLVISGFLTALIPTLPVTTPVFVALLGALIGSLLPTLQAAGRATTRRRDFRHVVGSFLDLVALNLAGGRGVPEALVSAAGVSDGWAMIRLRDTLALARLQGVTPWSALGDLGERTGVAELRDLAAALDLVADDGAKVRESLAARAASLRRRELADAEGRAQARSQSMLVAQLLLAVGFLVFLIYPAVVRVVNS